MPSARSNCAIGLRYVGFPNASVIVWTCRKFASCSCTPCILQNCTSGRTHRTSAQPCCPSRASPCRPPPPPSPGVSRGVSRSDSRVVDLLDSPLSAEQVVRVHPEYQCHGEPLGLPVSCVCPVFGRIRGAPVQMKDKIENQFPRLRFVSDGCWSGGGGERREGLPVLSSLLRS